MLSYLQKLKNTYFAFIKISACGINTWCITPMDGKISKLGDLLKTYLRESGLEHKLLEASVPTFWQETVGNHIAAQSKYKRFEDGRLFIEVEAAVWRQELLLRREDIRTKINTRAGKEIVKEIIIR